MNFIQKAAFKLVKNSVDDYIQKFLQGEDVYEISNPESITELTAMKYTAVFACCRVLAETLALTPIMLYKKDNKGERESVTDHKIYDVLHNAPNDEMSPFNYKEATMIALNLGGNSISQKLVNRLGDVVGLKPFLWNQVTIQRNKQTNELEYVVKNGNETVTLKRDQVLHIPGMSFDGIVGLSPIEYATGAIRLGKTYEHFGNRFYENGANASGAFKFANELSEIAFERLKSEVKKNYQGLKNAGVPMILEGGGEFQQFTIKPADAQLIENKRFQIEDIARIYRVPMHLIQDLTRSTNNNIEHQSLEFIMYTMLPWFKRYEENMNMQLLTREDRAKGYYLEFKIDTLLRGDAKSRAEAYAQGRQWGWLSVNDIRRLENMPSIGAEGDIYLTPANMYEAGKQPVDVKAVSEEIFKMIAERK